MMDVGARKWLVKTAYANLWRVDSFYEISDLVQDGWLCYMLVCRRYPQARTPEHIMRLFQVTYINHIHDLSKHQSRMKSLIEYVDDLTPAENMLDVRDAEPGDAYHIPQSAPLFVHQFLALLCSPVGPRNLRSRYRLSAEGFREMTHHRLCRLIGADPVTTPTLPAALFNYFHTV